jgi:hypothetical protein
MRDPYRTTLHRDGTVTYWSVTRQEWITRTRSVLVNDWPTLGVDKDRIVQHFTRHPVPSDA